MWACALLTAPCGALSAADLVKSMLKIVDRLTGRTRSKKARPVGLRELLTLRVLRISPNGSYSLSFGAYRLSLHAFLVRQLQHCAQEAGLITRGVSPPPATQLSDLELTTQFPTCNLLSFVC